MGVISSIVVFELDIALICPRGLYTAPFHHLLFITLIWVLLRIFYQRKLFGNFVQFMQFEKVKIYWNLASNITIIYSDFYSLSNTNNFYIQIYTHFHQFREHFKQKSLQKGQKMHKLLTIFKKVYIAMSVIYSLHTAVAYHSVNWHW